MKKIVLLSFCLLSFVFILSGCNMQETKTSGSTAQIEQNLTEENQKKLLDAQKPPKLSWSLERDNLIRRTNLWNDKNKVSYIYLIHYGKVMAFYPIKGKVSSVNSQLTNTEQIKTGGSASAGFWATTLPSPSEDGSYGSNGNAIFFFDTNGVYYEWAGDYLLVDQPMKLATPPEIVREIK